ncbi:MAG: hypothetical protein ACI9CU_001102 [Polaribacter sp.]|jgi:hypothetical protein
MGLTCDFCGNHLGVSLVRHHLFRMKKTFINPVFLVCLFLASFNQVLEKVLGIFIPIAHSYLDDFLCFPIVLTLGLAAYRWHNPQYKLTAWHIWPVVLFYALYFEWYLPQTSAAYTSDILDVLMYVLGALVFQRYINRSSTDLQATSLKNS